ncbi:unnamed protein product [Polarella glacialis]|uniref:Peroxisomal membrane protein PEX16 n=3 Tax=Polarella glacialis TaxID=89957 RepID=A0A813JN50_POLGL|nr:unnamed protein product [Polarella glacialis]
MGAIEAALAAQRSFMSRWGEPLEQLLSVGVFLVPVQEEEDDHAGFYSQAVYSATDLFNLYRTVLLRSPDELPVCEPSASGTVCATGSSSPQLRHLRLTYTLAAFALRSIRSVQVLLEMHAARRGGPRHALHVCLRIEVVKLALKMLLRSRMPFAFYVDEDAIEEVEPPKLLEQKRAMMSSLGQTPPEGAAGVAGSSTFVGRRSGRALPALEGSGDTSLAVAQPPPPRVADGLRADSTPVGDARLVAAELLHHSRPLLHLLLLLRRGRKSWVAWWAAFLIDRLSLAFLVPQVSPRPGTRAAALEVAEVRRRKNLMWWALARSPAFDLVLLRPCQILDQVLKRIPVINLFNIMELFLVLQPNYFSTSGS